MSTEFLQYVRDRHNQKIGVFVVNIDDTGNMVIGHSLCATKRGETFSREFGKRIASGRKNCKRNTSININDKDGIEKYSLNLPQSTRSIFNRIVGRCQRIVNKKNETISS